MSCEILQTMEKNRIVEVLSRWNFWSRDLEVGIARGEPAVWFNSLVSTLSIGGAPSSPLGLF